MAKTRFDLSSLGETMLRLAVPRGERLDRMQQLDVTAGGAESNVAVAVARMGYRAAWVSRLPRSPLGRRIEQAVRAEGVDTSGVVWTDVGRVGTYFIEYAPPPRRIEVVYDRNDSAAAQLAATDLDWELLLDTQVFHLSGITPGLSASCLDAATEACERARRAGVTLSFDVNYRARLWSPQAAAAALLPLMRMARVLICGRADAATLWGLEGDAEAVLRNLQQLAGAPMVVLTLGKEGALAIDEQGAVLAQPALSTEVVDRIGVGDAFSAGVLCGVLEGSLQNGLRYGAAMGAHKLTTHGDVLLATRQEILDLLEQPDGSRPAR